MAQMRCRTSQLITAECNRLYLLFSSTQAERTIFQISILQSPKIIENRLISTGNHHVIKEEHSQTIGKQVAVNQMINENKMPVNSSSAAQPIPTQLIDVRNPDGQIIQVNIEDISQFLNYHEVFGKLPSDNSMVTVTSTPYSAHSPILPNNISSSSSQPSNVTANNVIVQANQKLPSTVGVLTPKLENITNSLGSLNNASGTIGATTTTTATDGSIVSPFPSATHTCDVCGKMFPFKYQLIVHRRYHNERKPFICQVCGQAFLTTLELTTHGKSHDGNNMFTCNVCYHVFANTASLERHVKRHATDKPFGCSICQKTFSRKEHLDNHFRSHTGETPFRWGKILTWRASTRLINFECFILLLSILQMSILRKNFYEKRAHAKSCTQTYRRNATSM